MENELKNQKKPGLWEKFKNAPTVHRLYAFSAALLLAALSYVGFSKPEATPEIKRTQTETVNDSADPARATLDSAPKQEINRETIKISSEESPKTEKEVTKEKPKYKSFLPPGSFTIYLPNSSKKMLQYDDAESFFKIMDEFENAPIKEMLKEAQQSLLALLPETDDELSRDTRQKLEAWDDHLTTLEADLEFIRKYVSPGVELTPEIAERLEDIQEQTAYFAGQVRYFGSRATIKLYGMPEIKEGIDDFLRFMSDNGRNIPDEVMLSAWKDKMINAIDAIEADYDYETFGIIRPLGEGNASIYAKKLTEEIYNDLIKLRSMQDEVGGDKYNLLVEKADDAAERMFDNLAENIARQPQYVGKILGSPFHSMVISNWDQISPINIEMLIVDYDPLVHLAKTVESLGDDVNLENIVIISDMIPHQVQDTVDQFQEAVKSGNVQKVSELEEILLGLMIGTHKVNYDDEIILNPDYSPTNLPSFEYKGTHKTKHYDTNDGREVYIDVNKAKLYLNTLRGLAEHGAEIRAVYSEHTRLDNIQYHANKETLGNKTAIVITPAFGPEELGIPIVKADEVTIETFEDLQKKWQKTVTPSDTETKGQER